MTNLAETFLLLGGAILMLTAGVGILRLPTLLCRTHALAKAVTLGLTFLLIALYLHIGTSGALIKIVAVITFHFITLPIAGQIFASYAYRRGQGTSK